MLAPGPHTGEGEWTIFKVLTRVWIPLVVVLVVAAAAFGVYRLHGVFGSTNINQAVGIKDDSKNIIPKDIVYEIFGPQGQRVR
ncbi:membrane protein mmpS4 [Mycobacteroides abscessus]|nr:membrane protein mmpS4 [Mycobacteroides abscessus]